MIRCRGEPGNRSSRNEKGLTLFVSCLKCRFLCGNSSVGRARPCQGRGREFESRFPLQIRGVFERLLLRQGPARGALLFPGPSLRQGAVYGTIASGRICQGGFESHRPGGRVVMQRTANPRTPVQFRPRPPKQNKQPGRRRAFCFVSPIRPYARLDSRSGNPSRKLSRDASCPDGGIGRRSGLKIRRPHGRAGSIPAPGTISSYAGTTRPAPFTLRRNACNSALR